MNILQVLPELNVGGVETGTVDLSKHLVLLGHKAVVVSAGGQLVKSLESAGAVHYTLPVHDKSIFSMLKTVPKLAEIINREKIDVVHARSRVPGWIAYFACRKTGAAFITTCHGYYTRHYFSRVMGWGKRVIVLSNVIGRHMIEDFGVPHDRIRLIPRSVDIQRFRYVPPDKKRKDEFNVGIIGRLTPIKGHLHFIKAMAKVARSIPHLKIWIVGEAPSSKESYKEEVQILVRRLGLWHCTQFLGTQRDIPAIMANLDLLVMATTTQEAFGRVIIEAQAAGVPVIATKVGGAIDIIEHGKTGLLVPPADSSSMAEATIKIFKDPILATRMSEAAYQKVKDVYNLERMVKSTLDVYEESLKVRNILIIKISSVGDVILSTAAIKAVRDKFPHPYRISVLVGLESKDFLLSCPYVDEVLVCDLKGKDKGIKGLWALAMRLSQFNFDITIDLQNNRKSHLLSFLTLAGQRYGYDNKKFGFLLNKRVKPDKAPMSPIAHQSRVLELLGINLNGISLELWPSVEDQSYVVEFLKSEWVSPGQKLVGINLSASSRWKTKNWPSHHIVKLCEELGRQDIRVVLTGTEKDAKAAGNLLGSVKNARPINACGKTNVNQLACLIKLCAVYISTDSAPLHIAAAVGTPAIALFGPTDQRRHLPPAKEIVVISKDLLCSPCYRSKCKHTSCMESIKPEEVLKAIDKYLQ